MEILAATNQCSHATQPVIPDILSVLHSTSRLPFSLQCAGGRWEGYFLGWQHDGLHVQIRGFPPIEISQYIQVHYVVNGHLQQGHRFQGLIQDLRLEQHSLMGESLTDILLEYHPWNSRSECFQPGKAFIPPVPLENALYGQLSSKGRRSYSWKTGKSDQVTIFPSPRKSERDSVALTTKETNIHSTPLIIEKRNGQRIRAFHDRPVDKRTPTLLPIVVISPGYGETKRDYLTLAYYFATNGFHVLRYDHTNHVGESDGCHYDITLSSMKDDFHTVTRYVRATWPDSPLTGVASSLAARVVLKAEAEYPSLSLFIMLMGIVNVQRSAATVHQEDIFAGYSRGHSPVSANILGFNVGNHFLEDAIAHRFVTLEHTLNDARSSTSPVIVLSAGKDAWVASDDLQAFRQALGERVVNWIVVPDALHRLQENPRLAHATYRQLVAKCQERMTTDTSHRMVNHPNRQDLGRQNRKEKAALQQQALTAVGTDFWQNYLDHFLSVSKCPDYVKLLDHVFHALGPIQRGHKFLDVGCGNGNGGLYFLHRLHAVINDLTPCKHPVIKYTGIDLIPDALKRAKRMLASAMANSHRLHISDVILKWFWAQVDVNHSLPFPDNQFDRIISNLVLGYTHDPRAVLQELYRILAPGGRMVISNLKPNGDFSGIYQSLVHSAALHLQREEARELLNNYGKIRQAEKEGHFCFFDHTQWKSIVAALGCPTAEIYPTFGGQAYLVILEKPALCAQPYPLNIPQGVLKQVA